MNTERRFRPQMLIEASGQFEVHVDSKMTWTHAHIDRKVKEGPELRIPPEHPQVIKSAVLKKFFGAHKPTTRMIKLHAAFYRVRIERDTERRFILWRGQHIYLPKFHAIE